VKILKLEIRTSNIEDQLKFYKDLMGLEILKYDEESFEIQVGYTLVRFLKDKDATPYHIAFHIPDKQEEKALNWLKDRVGVVKNNIDEIVDFPAWDARSIYFYDRDKNILEFISRRNFNKPNSAIFSEKSILGVSEIGLATSSIEKQLKILQEECGLEIFDGNLERFCAIGDDAGLIITIDKNLKTWFPTGDKAYTSEFKLEFLNKGDAYKIHFKDDFLFLLKQDR
jgi:catechol-2,3-dioxygenase